MSSALSGKIMLIIDIKPIMSNLQPYLTMYTDERFTPNLEKTNSMKVSSRRYS